MAETLQNIDLKSILILLAAVILYIIILSILKLFFTILADAYIKRNKDKLFDANASLAQKNKDLGDKLLDEMNVYMEYIDDLGVNQEYECSSSIVSNASNDVIKYLIKYSDIEYSEYCLECIDFCINYMQSLKNFQTDMIKLQKRVVHQLPIFVRLFATREKIAYTICEVSDELEEIENPVFCFSYVSPAGRNCRTCDIEITTEILKDVQSEISARMTKSEHAKMQRSAMTNDLREAIKQRDHYTCCICGNSVYNEPNLLLEVDHIIPVSRGGKTEADNLQTLCWRCNRRKAGN